jgi:putative RecB family exonuclease
MGSRVHEALEKFYEMVKLRTIKPKDWLLDKYQELWQKKVHPTLKVVKEEKSLEDYRLFGAKCLDDYYETYQPFDQAKVIKTEEFLKFPVRAGADRFEFCGVLDRLDWNDRDRLFEIHDYKTSGTLPTQEAADADPQLGLYHLAVKNQWPEAEEVRLIWHYLAFNKQIESRRSAAQLEDLQTTIVRQIKEVEACKEYPPTKSALCAWCAFQPICPLWKHPLAMAGLPANEFLQDPGVKLVARYAELEDEKEKLQARIYDLETEQDKIGEAALALGEKENLRVIDGPEHELVLTINDEWAAPLRRENAAEWEGLRDALLKDGKYADVSTVNNQMLNRMLREWPLEFRDKVRKFLIRKQVRKAALRKKNP